MAGKILFENVSPVTQTIDSGKTLASFLGIKEELPEIIPLVDGARLVLSSKKDAYYIVTPKGCSCKGFTYRHICKHIKGKWATGGNGPVMPEAVPRISILANIIDAYAPHKADGEVRHWQQKQAQEA